MANVRAVSEVSWNSFDPTMSIEGTELMAQLLGPCHFANEHELDTSFGIPSMFWSDHDFDSYNFSNSSNSSSNYWSQLYSSSTSTSSFFSPSSEYETYCRSDPNVIPMISVSSPPMDFCVAEDQITHSSIQIVPTNQFEDPIYLNEETSSDDFGISSGPVALHDQTSLPKRKFQLGDNNNFIADDNGEIPTGSQKKKIRSSVPVQKRVKNAGSKKSQKSDHEESNAALNAQSSSCCSSDDDSNASQELNGGVATAALKQNAKTRAGRGSATDPQSLYARKRRERISERLRILQTLVPNGTKVDISTMLEEAVEYVKFLQLQIKLLSSDEHWMYAPIAYNGMDIGIDR